MSRAILGGLLGGGAATVYLRPDIVSDFAKDKALQSLLASKSYSTTAGNSREIEQLTKLVEQLARDVAISKQGGGVTIVQQGHGRSGSWALYALSIGGLVVAYFVVFKGWRLSDFFYVTRRSLKQGLDSVNKGLEDMRGRLDHVKQALQEKINVLMRKQDQTISQQKELQGQLNVVGEDVDTIRSQVGQIHGLVLDVTSGLTEVGANQRHANQGIYILCKAVSELMQGSNIPSKKELIDYTQHPIWTAEKLQGLEGILCQIPDNTERRPGLLLEGGAGGRFGSRKALTDTAELPMEHIQGNGYSGGSGNYGSGGGFGSGGCGVGNGSWGSEGGYGSGGGGEGRQQQRGVQQSSSFSFGGGPVLGRVSPSFGGSSGGGIIFGPGASRFPQEPASPW